MVRLVKDRRHHLATSHSSCRAPVGVDALRREHVQGCRCGPQPKVAMEGHGHAFPPESNSLGALGNRSSDNRGDGGKGLLHASLGVDVSLGVLKRNNLTSHLADLKLGDALDRLVRVRVQMVLKPRADAADRAFLKVGRMP